MLSELYSFSILQENSWEIKGIMYEDLIGYKLIRHLTCSGE